VAAVAAGGWRLAAELGLPLAAQRRAVSFRPILHHLHHLLAPGKYDLHPYILYVYFIILYRTRLLGG